MYVLYGCISNNATRVGISTILDPSGVLQLYKIAVVIKRHKRNHTHT